MIRVPRVDEPAEFDARCRARGREWLANHPGATRPKALWREFVGHLATGFGHRCGYSAIHIQSGTIDHFLGWQRHPELAYEWTNFRYVDGRINAKKQSADEGVLDPFEIGDDWFEILIPSLQLRVTDAIPAELRDRARYTLERLGLDHDEHVIAYRAQWYCMYHCSELSLEGLRRVAPLIARAIQNADQRPDPTLCTEIRARTRR